MSDQTTNDPADRDAQGSEKVRAARRELERLEAAYKKEPTAENHQRFHDAHYAVAAAEEELARLRREMAGQAGG